MAFLLLLAVATSLLALGSNVQGNLFQLCEQLDYFGQLKPFLDCLEYNEYGCWCGFGGEGKTVDKIDACCKAHDECYSSVKKKHFFLCSPYFTIYDHGKGKCLNTNDGCAKETCECDNALAKCTVGKMYNMKFKGYRKTGKCNMRK